MLQRSSSARISTTALLFRLALASLAVAATCATRTGDGRTLIRQAIRLDHLQGCDVAHFVRDRYALSKHGLGKVEPLEGRHGTKLRVEEKRKKTQR